MSSTLFETNPAATVLSGQTIAFTVYGTPKPQGSMRAFFRPGMKHPVVTSDNKQLKPWRQQITATAMELSAKLQPKETALAMSLDFYFTKPPSVSKKRIYPTVKPDTDKLIRSILDSLKGVLYVDDSQVCRFDHIQKHYGAPERVEIQVRVL